MAPLLVAIGRRKAHEPEGDDDDDTCFHQDEAFLLREAVSISFRSSLRLVLDLRISGEQFATTD